MLNKKYVYCIAVVLMLTLISPTMLTVVAQVNDSTSALESRPTPYPKDVVVSPVEEKITEFKAQGLNDDQIVEELVKMGMWWNPGSGATGTGIFVPADQFGSSKITRAKLSS